MFVAKSIPWIPALKVFFEEESYLKGSDEKVFRFTHIIFSFEKHFLQYHNRYLLTGLNWHKKKIKIRKMQFWTLPKTLCSGLISSFFERSLFNSAPPTLTKSSPKINSYFKIPLRLYCCWSRKFWNSFEEFIFEITLTKRRFSL